MNRIQAHVQSPLDQVDLIGKLADLKDQHYQNSLLLSAMLELLVEKKLLTLTEIETKIKQLDTLFNPDPTRPIM